MKSKSLIMVLAGCGLLAAAGLGLHFWSNEPATLPAFKETDFHHGTPQVAVAPGKNLSPTQKIRLAIGNCGWADEAGNRRLMELISMELKGAQGIQLLEANALDANLRESKLVRPAEAMRAGKIMHADWFLLASLVVEGTNQVLVARILEVATGAPREVTVSLLDNDDLKTTAAKLANFVHDSRANASQPGLREFLALGDLTDLGWRSNEPGFPGKLRDRLISAYRGTKVTVLDRDEAHALLQEFRLDLASLAQSGKSEGPLTIPQTFWLVTGTFHAMQEARESVELSLGVQRILGFQTNTYLRGKPDEAFFDQIKSFVETARSNDDFRTRRYWSAESAGLADKAKDLVDGSGRSVMSYLYGETMDSERRKKDTRTLAEAVRLSEAALFLEPTNGEARLTLGTSLKGFPFFHDQKALECYRQLLDGPISPEWTNTLVWGIRGIPQPGDGTSKLNWYRDAFQKSTNLMARSFYQEEIRKQDRDRAVQNGDPEKVSLLATERFLEEAKTFESNRWYQNELGLDKLEAALNLDKVAFATFLNSLRSKIKEAAPTSYHYFVASMAAHQNDPNSPISKEFDQVLTDFISDPAKTPTRFTPFSAHLESVGGTFQAQGRIDQSARIKEAVLRSAGEDPTNPTAGGKMEEGKLQLALIYMELHRWADALKLIESCSPQIVNNFNYSQTILVPFKLANRCRKELGIPEIIDPKEFAIGDTGFCFCPSDENRGQDVFLAPHLGTFEYDKDGLWLAVEGLLRNLNTDLRTNFTVKLPIHPRTPITQIASSSNTLWIATGGEGLLEYDKPTRTFRKFGESDGLMMGYLATVYPSRNELWLGYGLQSSGGLGKLDLPTHKPVSFLSSTKATPANPRSIPHTPITSITLGVSNEVWLTGCAANVTQLGLFRYSPDADAWENLPNTSPASCLASGEDALIVGQGGGIVMGGQVPGLGVRLLGWKDRQWITFPSCSPLPDNAVSTLTLDVANLWVGGFGYVAVTDLKSGKVLKYGFVPCRSVEKIAIGGGYLWAQAGNRLYRAGLK